MGVEPVENDVLVATNWLIARCVNNQGRFEMNWFGLSNNIFTTLGVSCPLLAPLRRNLGGLRTLLEVVCIGVKDRQNQSTYNQALLGLFQDAERAAELLSFGYHEGYQRPHSIKISNWSVNGCFVTHPGWSIVS